MDVLGSDAELDIRQYEKSDRNEYSNFVCFPQNKYSDAKIGENSALVIS